MLISPLNHEEERMALDLEEAEFRVIVGEEDPEQGQTHTLHLDAEKNQHYQYRAPVSYATKFGQALLFGEGYYIGSLLVRIQRKMSTTGQWIDHS
jgi:hypothetical protein